MKAFLVTALLWLVFDGSHGEEMDCVAGPKPLCVDSLEHVDVIGELVAADSKADALLRICPNMKSYMNCSGAYAKRCLSDQYAEQFYGYLNLFVELCDPESSLHRDFINNIECYLKQVNGLRSCFGHVMEQENLYLSHYRDVEVNAYHLYRGGECLSGYLMAGCTAGKFLETCGEDASNFFLELAHRSKQLCSQDEMQVALLKYFAIMTKNVNKAPGESQLFKILQGTK